MFLKKKSSNKKSGFLLIELVVALAIFAIFMKAIFSLQAQMLVSQKRMQKRIQVLESSTRAREAGGTHA